MAPPPKICNRVGDCEWKSGGSGCECEVWPQWLHQHGVPSGRATVVTGTFHGNTAIDSEATGIHAAGGSACSYYRPNGTTGFYFYNGLISSVHCVRFFTGKEKTIVAVN